ncbi:n-terminal region, partial [Cystoisospora suis]
MHASHSMRTSPTTTTTSTTDWQCLDNVWYRKVDIYTDMKWSEERAFRFEFYVIAAA